MKIREEQGPAEKSEMRIHHTVESKSWKRKYHSMLFRLHFTSTPSATRLLSQRHRLIAAARVTSNSLVVSSRCALQSESSIMAANNSVRVAVAQMTSVNDIAANFATCSRLVKVEFKNCCVSAVYWCLGSKLVCSGDCWICEMNFDVDSFLIVCLWLVWIRIEAFSR